MSDRRRIFICVLAIITIVALYQWRAGGDAVKNESGITTAHTACWVEPNADTPEGVEKLSGPLDRRPPRSITIPCR